MSRTAVRQRYFPFASSIEKSIGARKVTVRVDMPLFNSSENKLATQNILSFYERNESSSSELSESTREFLFRNDLEAWAYLAEFRGNDFTTPTTPAPSSVFANGVIVNSLGAPNTRIIPDDLSSSVSRDNHLLLGGPVNNIASRMLLGTGNNSKFFRLLKNSRYHNGPPVRFNLDRGFDDLAHGRTPEWTVIRNGEDIAQDGDFLLLTSVVNIFNPKTRLLSLAGKHSHGMRATQELLLDQALIERLKKSTKQMNAWQILLPVKGGNEGRHILKEEVQIFEINDDFQVARDQEAILKNHSSFIELCESLSDGETVVSQTYRRKTAEQEQATDNELDLSRKENGNTLWLPDKITVELTESCVNASIEALRKSGAASEKQIALTAQNIAMAVEAGLSGQSVVVGTNATGVAGEKSEPSNDARAMPTTNMSARHDDRPIENSGQLGDASVQLPSKAPALWKQDKLPSHRTVDGKLDTPPAFIMRHYGQWIGKGLMHEHVEDLDPELSVALRNYLADRTNKKGQKELPEGFDLPTRTEKTDRWVNHVLQSRGINELTGDVVKDLAREATAARRRLKRGEGNITHKEVLELGRLASAARIRWKNSQDR